MLKKLTFAPSLLISLLGLTGCVAFTPPQYDTPKDKPRPVSTESSYAMEVTKAIKTSANCFGCADTYLWESESAYADRVGFVPSKVIRQLNREHDRAFVLWHKAIQEWRDNGSDPATRPVPPSAPVESSRDATSCLSPYMIADSLDGRWTNPGASLGLGIALDIGMSLITTVPDENEDYPPIGELKAAMVLPDEDKIDYRHFSDSQLSVEENKLLNIGAYAAREFVKVLTKSAQDMGYIPVGDLRVEFVQDSKGKPNWFHVWQPLENETAGCPKVTENADRDAVCRVEWAPYRLPMERNQYTWRLERTTIPTIFGGDGVRIGWIAHFGYDRMNSTPLCVSVAKNEPSSLLSGTRDLTFATGIQKHLKEGQFVYVPTYFDNGSWSPQRVLDHRGAHYFSVIVSQE